MLVSLVLIALFLTGIAAYNAPRFLVYADKPVKSDAVVLFLGENFTARKREAAQLLDKGYAGYLIIPALNMVSSQRGIPVHVPHAPENRGQGRLFGYPRFYEDTHVELLYAKKLMNSMGLRSAIMVSSPYHMKRISMMAGSVFGDQSRLFSYVPTQYERDPIYLRDMNSKDWMFVMSEYIKICWFKIYSLLI